MFTKGEIGDGVGDGDGNGNENVISKYSFSFLYLFRDNWKFDGELSRDYITINGVKTLPSRSRGNICVRFNLVPRVLSLPRESTLVMAGHVSIHANYRRTEGGSSTNFNFNFNFNFPGPSLRSYLWNLLKSSRHVTSRNQGTFSR